MKYLMFSLLYSWVISCDLKKDISQSQPPVLTDRQLNAAFLIVEGVYNSELIAPMDVLQCTIFHNEHGIKVSTVAEKKDMINTFEGLHILPDYSFETDSLPPIDILIVPGAEHSMDSDLGRMKNLLSLQEVMERWLLMCSRFAMELLFLAKARLLDMHECTTFSGDIGKFKEAFPHLVVHEGISFVHDRKMITSAGGAKFYDPAL